MLPSNSHAQFTQVDRGFSKDQLAFNHRLIQYTKYPIKEELPNLHTLCVSTRCTKPASSLRTCRPDLWTLLSWGRSWAKASSKLIQNVQLYGFSGTLIMLASPMGADAYTRSRQDASGKLLKLAHPSCAWHNMTQHFLSSLQWNIENTRKNLHQKLLSVVAVLHGFRSLRWRILLEIKIWLCVIWL